MLPDETFKGGEDP